MIKKNNGTFGQSLSFYKTTILHFIYVQPNTIFTKAQKHALAKAKLNLAWHKYFIALENIGRDIFYLEM